jgi:hypothetical protein
MRTSPACLKNPELKSPWSPYTIPNEKGYSFKSAFTKSKIKAVEKN